MARTSGRLRIVGGEMASTSRRTTIPALCRVLGLLVLMCAACSGKDESSETAVGGQPQRGGTVVLGSISDVDSWNEYLSRQSFASNLIRRIYLRLAEAQGDGQQRPQSHEPMLAESWEFADDNLSLTFKLREAVWSDGRPVSAADVRFTWQAQTSPHVPWVGAEIKSQITNVEVLDERTVRFHFGAEYPFQLADAVEGGILPEHVFGAIPLEQWATHDWSQLSVGSGPFLLERYDPGHEITLRRNPRYFREGYPLLDQVVVRVVPDAGNLLTQLMAGEIDYLEGLAPSDAHSLNSNNQVGLLAFDYPKFDYIGWNGSRPPFDDPLIRRAMTLAIDREALVTDLLYGYGRVSKGPVLSFWWSANRGLEAWPHDLDEARRLLEAAGFATLDEDGQGSGTGRQLEFDLMTNSGNRLREDMLVKIQEQLARIGVKVNVRPVEMRAMRQQAASGEYDAYLGGWTFQGKVDLKAVFGSGATPPNGMNVVFYKSDEVDRLLEAAERARDWREVKTHMDSLQLQIHEDQPYTFLYETKRVAAYGQRLRDVEIDIPADPLARLERYWIQ